MRCGFFVVLGSRRRFLILGVILTGGEKLPKDQLAFSFAPVGLVLALLQR